MSLAIFAFAFTKHDLGKPENADCKMSMLSLHTYAGHWDFPKVNIEE